MKRETKSIFDFFKKDEPKKTNFSEVVTVDGITLFYEGELAVGTAVFVLDEQNNEIPAPEGDFQVDIEGVVYAISVDVNGVVTAMEQAMSGEPTPETMSKEEFNSIITKVIEDTATELNSLKEKYSALEEKHVALEEKYTALANAKESKFKDDRKKANPNQSLSIREILTKK